MFFKRSRAARRIRRVLNWGITDKAIIERRGLRYMDHYLSERRAYYNLRSDPYYRKIAEDHRAWVRYYRRLHFGHKANPPTELLG